MNPPCLNFCWKVWAVWFYLSWCVFSSGVHMLKSFIALSSLLIFLPLNLHSPQIGGASGKESNCQCRRCKRHEFDPWIGKIPWRRKWQRTSIFLPGKSHGQRSLARYSPWGHKESETDEWLSTHTHTHSPQVRKVIWWVPWKNIAGAHRSVIYFWIFKIHWFLPSSKYSDLYATIIKMSIYIWWLCAMSAWLRWNRTAKNSLFPG